MISLFFLCLHQMTAWWRTERIRWFQRTESGRTHGRRSTRFQSRNLCCRLFDPRRHQTWTPRIRFSCEIGHGCRGAWRKSRKLSGWMANLDEACCSEEMAIPPSLMRLCEHVLASLLNRGTLISLLDLSRILASLCVKSFSCSIALTLKFWTMKP